jgi:hypothetical protein
MQANQDVISNGSTQFNDWSREQPGNDKRDPVIDEQESWKHLVHFTDEDILSTINLNHQT